MLVRRVSPFRQINSDRGQVIILYYNFNSSSFCKIGVISCCPQGDFFRGRYVCLDEKEANRQYIGEYYCCYSSSAHNLINTNMNRRITVLDSNCSVYLRKKTIVQKGNQDLKISTGVILPNVNPIDNVRAK